MRGWNYSIQMEIEMKGISLTNIHYFLRFQFGKIWFSKDPFHCFLEDYCSKLPFFPSANIFTNVDIWICFLLQIYWYIKNLTLPDYKVI